ncbi:unnamed protein product, partial [Didymodactylos carnosus]
ITLKQRNQPASFELTSDNYNTIGMMLYVLRPFKAATKLISGSSYPTVGLTLYAIRKIQNFLEKTADDENNENDELLAQMKTRLLGRLKHYTIDDKAQFKRLSVS